MNWYKGNIGQAIELSKTRQSIFVVYIEGTDDLSKHFTNLINDQSISSRLGNDRFVAIRIKSDSEEFVHFAQIYTIVPTPSLFFIGRNGTPIEIVTSITKSVLELSEKIDSVSDKTIASNQTMINQPNGDSPSISSNKTELEATPSNSPDTGPSNSTTISTDEQAELKMLRAQKLIDQRRKEKEAEQKLLEKERELQRRQVGKDLASFRQRQNEIDLKQLKDDRKKDKQEEMATRKRILEQIAQDRLERSERFDNSAPQVTSPINPISVSVPLNVDNSLARIQFKKPDGETHVYSFNGTDTFGIVRKYVRETILSGVKDFLLATTFPRKEYTEEFDDRTLIELEMVPNTVLLILLLNKPTGGISNVASIIPKPDVAVGYISRLFWFILTPLMSVVQYMRAMIFNRNNNNNTGAQKRAGDAPTTDHDEAKRRNLERFDRLKPNDQPSTSTGTITTSGTYKRRGDAPNIHRLADMRDSDDENNTWNGNSTQQQ